MAGVSDPLCAIQSPHWIRSLYSSHMAISRANEFSPFLDAILSDKLHTHHEVAAHEFGQFIVKWLTL